MEANVTRIAETANCDKTKKIDIGFSNANDDPQKNLFGY
jgi:hypothetical protein